MIVLKTIDAHAGGQALRLIVDGFPAPRGKTMAEKRVWAASRADHLRRAVLLEPRGHADLSGAVLTEPVSSGSHAGVLCMDNAGFSAAAPRGIAAAAMIALARGLVHPGGDGATVAFDTPAGTVRVIRGLGPRVTLTGVPSFVLEGGVLATVGTRRIRADVAFGGGFFAIVDAESIGVPADAAHLPELRRTGMEVARAVDAVVAAAHPHDKSLSGVIGTVFTGPARTDDADLRAITVFASGQVDRSPCEPGVCAVLAVLDAMGLIEGQSTFTLESVINATCRARIASRSSVGEYSAIMPEIEGEAWITGDHAFVLDSSDPWSNGFHL